MKILSDTETNGNTKLSLLFDIDGTLTLPRQPLPQEMGEALKRLSLPFHVAAGSDLGIIEPQLLQPLWKYGFRKDIEAFVSCGATHYHCPFSKEYRIEKVSDFDFGAYLGKDMQADLIKTLTEILELDEFHLPPHIKIIGERITLRGSMINFAPVGRPKGSITEEVQHNRDEFRKFDSATGYRMRMRAQLNQKLSWLIKHKNLRILIGGKTGFDILIEGYDKTLAVKTLLGMGYTEVIFLGDALTEGGNDAAITDYIANWHEPLPCPLSAIAVKDWEDTLRILRDHDWITT